MIWFFLKLIVTCRLGDVYVSGDNDSNVQIMIHSLYGLWCLRKAAKLDNSFI